MPPRKKKKKTRSSRLIPNAPTETTIAETITIAWTVTVTTLLLSNLTNVLVHFYVNGNPGAKRMILLQQLLLAAGAIIGVLSLLLIPLVYRLRQAPPPKGLVVFGACCAVAPIVALLARTLG